MKICIYFPGLGQSFSQESVSKYATRIMHELDVNHENRQLKYCLKPEKVIFLDTNEISVVSIVEQDGDNERIVYKLYEFNYGCFLKERFSQYNILIKSFILFSLVIQKFPRMVLNLFKRSPYKRNLESFYVFFLFLIIASAILFLIPSALAILLKVLDTVEVKNVFDSQWYNGYIKPVASYLGISRHGLEEFSQAFVSVTAIILILIPKAKIFVTDLATEFVCSHNYLENGQQSQKILGMLDQLVEFIAEREPGCTKLHYHSYSFGSVVAFDHLYPYGNSHAASIKKMAECLITIGAPFEFINAYYPSYFGDRDSSLNETITWVNVYSLNDALASNFRNDGNAGKAEYPLVPEVTIPENIQYEISKPRRYGIVDFLFLHSLKAHSQYWDKDAKEQSCIREVFKKLKQMNLMESVDLNSAVESGVAEVLSKPVTTDN